MFCSVLSTCRASCFVILGAQLRSVCIIQSLQKFRRLNVVLLFVASLYQFLFGLFYPQRTYWTMAVCNNINIGHVWLEMLSFDLETCLLGLLIQHNLIYLEHCLLTIFGLVYV